MVFILIHIYLYCLLLLLYAHIYYTNHYTNYYCINCYYYLQIHVQCLLADNLLIQIHSLPFKKPTPKEGFLDLQPQEGALKPTEDVGFLKNVDPRCLGVLSTEVRNRVYVYIVYLCSIVLYIHFIMLCYIYHMHTIFSTLTLLNYILYTTTTLYTIFLTYTLHIYILYR